MADDDYCYLTTTGRVSGLPHEIEVWYVASDDGRTLYMLAGAGDGSDWVRNLRADPACSVRIGRRDAPSVPAAARMLDTPDEEAVLARRVVFEKYQPRNDGDLSGWRVDSLPVAFDLT
ncbi:hypothetical protein BH10ACT3_BH10ACT3_03540 [soil metagenome]